MAYNYYRKFGENYLVLKTIKCSKTEAEIATKKLSRHFKFKTPTIEWCRGNRHNCSGRTSITYNVEKLTWLELINVMSLCWKLNSTGHEQNSHWYDKKYLRLASRMANYSIKKGWHAGTIEGSVKQKEENKVEREQIQKSPITKIERKKIQIKKLERRIKTLSTRLKSAKRSLNSLERYQTKKALDNTLPQSSE